MVTPIVEHFVMYVIIKLLHCTSEMNIVLCQLHLNKNLKNQVHRFGLYHEDNGGENEDI